MPPIFTHEIHMKPKKQCGAHARTTGAPCKAQGLPNGRCKHHGGMSTGPKTPEGKRAIATATKARMFNGQLQVAKTGFQRWLAGNGFLGWQSSAGGSPRGS